MSKQVRESLKRDAARRKTLINPTNLSRHKSQYDSRALNPLIMLCDNRPRRFKHVHANT